MAGPAALLAPILGRAAAAVAGRAAAGGVASGIARTAGTHMAIKAGIGVTKALIPDMNLAEKAEEGGTGGMAGPRTTCFHGGCGETS